MALTEDSYPDYPVFKGLQRPLEIMGLKGRYITWAAVTIGAAIIVFIVCYIISGFLLAITFLTIVLGIGGVTIFVKQHFGLYSKKIYKGIFVYHHKFKKVF